MMEIIRPFDVPRRQRFIVTMKKSMGKGNRISVSSVASCSTLHELALLVVLSTAFAVGLGIGGSAIADQPGRVRFAGPYLYHLNLSDDAWQRLLNTPEVTYICSQYSMDRLTAAELSEESRRVIHRTREAHGAGKRIVAQLWYGGWGRCNWSYYSLAHIAMDPEIRDDFFRNVLDPAIDRLGPENLYAVHLLEETGMQFGTDVDEPGDPNDLTDGDDNGSNWDQPSWLGRGGVAGYIGGPYTVNVRRYNSVFRKETGLDLRLAPIWSGRDQLTYRKWVSDRLEGGALREFAKHVRAKYPGLKVFTWDHVGSDGCGAYLMQTVRDHIDGVIQDPYGNAYQNYVATRRVRMMSADLEIVSIMWGVDDKPKGEIVNRFVSAWLGGANVVGYFGDKSIETDKAWTDRLSQVRNFLKLKPARHRPKVLLISGRTQDYGGSPAMMTHLTWFDEMSALEANVISLDRYDLVILYEANHPGVADYVAAGGRAVYVGPSGDPDFLVRRGILQRPTPRQTHFARRSLEYRPGEWWRQHAGLAECYPITIASFRPWKPAGTAVVQDELLLFCRYGKGAVVMMPFQTTWPYPPREQLNAHRRLLRDVAYGLLVEGGKEATARQSLSDPEIGCGYLRVPLEGDGQIGWALFRQGELPFQPQQVSGHDLIRNLANPTIGPNCSAAIVEP